MFGITQRGSLRWKEWVPLITQQQRLRSLIQVTAYNINVSEKIDKSKYGILLYYYTLHLSPMSSPFYTSEKLESENPKWAELEINPEFGAAPGVIIRLWCWCDSDDVSDFVVTAWGIHFSGLSYVGPRAACADPSRVAANTVVLRMTGGYFTSPHCFIDPLPPVPHTISITLPASCVKSSYSVNLLLKLQGLQQSIARQGAAVEAMRQEMVDGVRQNQRLPAGRALRRYLTQEQPAPQHVRALSASIEALRFKVQLLYDQRDMAYSRLNSLRNQNMEASRSNQIRGCQLMDKYYILSKEIEKLKKFQKETSELRSSLEQTSMLLDYRRKQLISELQLIYPIKEDSENEMTVAAVRLPDAESLEGEDDVRVSVALGFVAHLVHMISVFLDVPLRYPLCHFGSRSKIIDHITDKIPDKDREFPLYRGKEKLLFEYGVYLLNKNIAQLRWCCGITTNDLKATLPNLKPLFSLNNLALPRQHHCSIVSRSSESSAGQAASVSSDPQSYLHTWTSSDDIPNQKPP